MLDIKKNTSLYFVYSIILFIFLPINFLPQLMDGISIKYAYEIKNIEVLNYWYAVAGRYFHLMFIHLINFLSNLTSIPAEFYLDNILIIFLVLLCIEVKKYSRILFSMEEKWCNLAALFTAIFPIWHILVNFDIGQYIISLFFLFFGFRNFTYKSLTKSILGIIFIILSFNVESNLSLVVGLAIIFFIFKKTDDKNYISAPKVFIIIFVSLLYYILRLMYFAPVEIYEGLNIVSMNNIGFLFSKKLLVNIFNFSTFLLFYIWIPIVIILQIALVNRDNFSIKYSISFQHLKNYFILIALSGFAIIPYLLMNKSSTIFYVTDYYQRHAILLAPIFGMFFSNMFCDLNKLNCFKKKINISFYLIIFVCINLLILNYGNYRKIESHLFKTNLTSELKNYGPIPKGPVLLVVEDIKKIVGEFRIPELNYAFYKAYGSASWWVTPFHPDAYREPIKPPKIYLNNKKYSHLFIMSDYKYECGTFIYLNNTSTIYERIKKFYIFNYKKYYKIREVVKSC